MCAEPGTSPTFVRPRYTLYPLTAGFAATVFHMTCTLVALPACAQHNASHGFASRAGTAAMVRTDMA
jgi:hypothetical protein